MERIRKDRTFSSIRTLTSPLLFFLLSAAEPAPIKEVSLEKPIITFTPRYFGGYSCERLYISPLSRVYNIESYANSRKVSLNVSASLPEYFHWKIEVCSHRNASMGLCKCESSNWKSLQNGQWNGFISPYEKRYIDVRIKDQISKPFSLSIEEEFQQWRLVCLGIGFMLLILAPLVSEWVPFYYSSSMALGILLVVLLVLFQGMKLLPLGRKNLLYLAIYGSVLGMGSYITHYFSSIVSSIPVNIGLSEEMHNPVLVFLIVLVVLAGAGLGHWVVRKFVLSVDGRVDSGVARFVLWAMRVIAIFFILQSSLDPLLALGTLGASCYISSFVGSQTLASKLLCYVSNQMGRKGGTRKDGAWNHCTKVNGNGLNLECNYCHHQMWGGTSRMKHHLAGTNRNVAACIEVPDNVKELYRKLLKKKETTQEVVEEEVNENIEEEGEVGDKRRGTMDAFVIRSNKGPGAAKKLKQISMNAIAKSRVPACRKIMRCIYVDSLPLSLVKSPYFKDMIEECVKYGLGLKIPTYHEARVTFLKEEVKDVHEMLNRYKKEWAETGCTLMSDGWTDGKSRSIVNFLVNSPMGTIFLKSIDASSYITNAQKLFELIDGVIEEIGEENVVQVVTDSASAYVRASELLMEKRKTLFWNPCAAHCLDLMLEDIGEISIFRDTIRNAKQVCTFIYNHSWVLNLFRQQKDQRELKRPGITRFATCFLTLESFQKNKIALKTLFGSKKWLESNFIRNYEGKKVEATIMDDRFWKQVKYCLKASEPLVRVLRLIDGDVKPTMGYIYEAMDRAKEEIVANFNNKESSYQKIWDVIDQRWSLQLHRPLYAAAYYLNPKFHYSANFRADEEVTSGLLETIMRMISDRATRFKIDEQLEKFKRAEGLFGKEMAIHARDKKQPAHWWEMYGGSTPELQQFAIRVMSLTCSATGCERNWSIFQNIHSKRRAKLEHQRLNNLVFVKYNIKLEKRQRDRENQGDRFDPISLSDSKSDDEWITEKELPTLANEAQDFSWMDISECLMEEEGGSRTHKKKKRGPRDLRYGKNYKDNRGKKVVQIEEDSEEEPILEDESETEEDEDINLDDDGDDDDSGDDPINDDNEDELRELFE